MEVPKSPCSNAPIQSVYCAISGRSRPSCERSAATRSGGEFSPAITEATSPGSTRNAANKTMEMPNSAAANSSRRRMTNRKWTPSGESAAHPVTDPETPTAGIACAGIRGDFNRHLV